MTKWGYEKACTKMTIKVVLDAAGKEKLAERGTFTGQDMTKPYD